MDEEVRDEEEQDELTVVSEELERAEGGRLSFSSATQASHMYGDFYGLDDLWTERPV